MTKTVFKERTKLQGLFACPTNYVPYSQVGKGHSSVIKPIYGYLYPLQAWAHQSY